MNREIAIKLPDKYLLNTELLNEIQGLNADLKIGKTADNTLLVGELDFKFEDYEFIELKFPTTVFPDSNFDELYDINPDELNFEQPRNHSILLKMGVFRKIGAITSWINGTLVAWADKFNTGIVYGETTDYELKKKNSDETEIREADTSYISFEKASEEVQDSWEKRIPIPPTLSIEIVSAKKSLKEALDKMANVWINYGTDLGLVICPFTRMVYIFETGKEGYIAQSIFTIFTHPLLPGYEGDFSKYVDKIS